MLMQYLIKLGVHETLAYCIAMFGFLLSLSTLWAFFVIFCIVCFDPLFGDRE